MRWLVVFLFLFNFPAHADDAAKLAGAWKLVSYISVDDESGEEKKVFGEHPVGRLILLPSGQMMALLTAEDRKPPQTDEDRAAALKSMFAYTGRYRVEGNTFTTTIDAAWNQSWVGTQQKRTFTLEGDRLNIVSMSQPSPNFAGKMMHGILVWQREP